MRNRTILVFSTVAVLFAMLVPAVAIEVPVPNGGFEARATFDAFADGVDKYPKYAQEAWRNWDKKHNGGESRIWNPGPVGVASQALFDVGFGGNAPEGDYMVVVRSRYLLKLMADGGEYGNSDTGADHNTRITRKDIVTGIETTTVSDPVAGTGGYDPASFRPGEGPTQLLTDTFDSTAKYTLTAQVGRLPDTVAEGGSTNYGSDSTNPSDYPARWFGYQIALAAGGLQADHSLYGGYVQDGVVVASDDTQNPAANTFALATANYLPNPTTQAAMDALDGEVLQVRLHVKADPARLGAGHAAFDDAKLTMIVAGDADEDDDVDLTDDTTVVSNFGTSTGMTWNEGDFTGDGGVDLNDAGLMIGNFGYPATQPDHDTASWTFAPVVDGLSTTITVDSTLQAFLSTEALDGATLTLTDQALAAATAQTGSGIQVGEFEADDLISGQEKILVEAPSLGLYNFEARWNVLGGVEQLALFTIEFTGSAVPEPSTIILMVVGMVGLVSVALRRRKKQIVDC